MDQAALVKSDRDIGAKVAEALSRVKIPVSLFDWTYVPRLEEWQLVIASPWFDTKGPLSAYRSLVGALQKANIYEEVPLRRVYLRSPTDPLVKTLERKVKEHHNEGFLHILKHHGKSGKQYSVVFAPIAGPGGAVPSLRFSNVEELVAFLRDDLGVTRRAIDEAFEELDRSDASSIYPVTLTTRQMKKLGFV
jgi:hypothetical protein